MRKSKSFTQHWDRLRKAIWDANYGPNADRREPDRFCEFNANFGREWSTLPEWKSEMIGHADEQARLECEAADAMGLTLEAARVIWARDAEEFAAQERQAEAIVCDNLPF